MDTRNIVLHLNGGIVQGVVADGPLPDGLRVFIVDDDTDGVDPKDDKLCEMTEGYAPAFFRSVTVDVLPPDEFVTYVPKDWKP